MRVAAPAVAAFLLGAPVWSSAAEGTPAADAPAEGQTAVWKQKELTFVYMGFTTKYSCDGLRDKVRGALLDLGARKKDLKVFQTGCSAFAGKPDPFPGVRVKMSVLEPATGSAGEKTVAAHWKPVDLQLRNSSFNDSGECELVEQIRDRIVPLFATRNVELTTNCIPHQATATSPTLKMQVLVADQKADKAGSADH